MNTSNLSSSQRCNCSSYGVFFELTKVESSDQEGNDTQVSFNTYAHTDTHTRTKQTVNENCLSTGNCKVKTSNCADQTSA